jgi:hypothetical protein
MSNPNKAIIFPREGNEFWPLPPDYPTLTAEGQRLARINACSIRDTPENAMVAWSTFRELYLLPEEGEGFDPGFYMPPIYPSPTGHYSLVKWLHMFDNIAVEAPRGWAKSTGKRSILLWKMLTEPRIQVNNILAKDDFVLEDTFRIKMQLEENERIVADFGDQKRDRGSGLWTGHALTLQNGTIYRAVPIEGKLRGLRGYVFLDDVEYDEGGPRSSEKLEALKERIIKVMLPMMDAGCKIVILGTYLGQRSFLYHVVGTDEDARFKSVEQGGDWFKVHIPAEDESGKNAWAAKYTRDFLDRKRRTMGYAAYAQEYLGVCMSEEDAIFRLSEGVEYSVGDDHNFQTPLASTTPITYNGEEVGPFNETVGRMTRVIVVDSATSLKTSADYSAVVVGGLDSKQRLWVLDAWQGRVLAPNLAEQVFRMAEKWRVNVVAVEAFGPYVEIFRIIRQHFHNRHTDDAWIPQVIEYRPPASYSKEDRILSMAWRFDQRKVALPAYLANTSPHVRELYRQIAHFTPDGRNLRHDDLIDAMSGIHFILRNSTPVGGSPIIDNSIVGRLRRGERYYEGTDVPLISTLRLDEIPPDLLSQIMLENQEGQFHNTTTYPNQHEPTVHVRLGG